MRNTLTHICKFAFAYPKCLSAAASKHVLFVHATAVHANSLLPASIIHSLAINLFPFPKNHFRILYCSQKSINSATSLSSLSVTGPASAHCTHSKAAALAFLLRVPFPAACSRAPFAKETVSSKGSAPKIHTRHWDHKHLPKTELEKILQRQGEKTLHRYIALIPTAEYQFSLSFREALPLGTRCCSLHGHMDKGQDSAAEGSVTRFLLHQDLQLFCTASINTNLSPGHTDPPLPAQDKPHSSASAIFKQQWFCTSMTCLHPPAAEHRATHCAALKRKKKPCLAEAPAVSY